MVITDLFFQLSKFLNTVDNDLLNLTFFLF